MELLSEVFYWLFNMSISASVAGIVILFLRKIRKLPRRLIHILWLIPFLRMWIPAGMSSEYSLMTLISKFTTKTVVVYEGTLDFTFTNHIMAAGNYSPITYKVDLLGGIFRYASIIWILVAAILLIITVIIYTASKSDIKDANLLRDNIYVSDKITSPAVYGVFNPRIIVPKDYELLDLHYIIAHESAHIQRKDNFWRIVAVVSAAVHWFNPLVWLFLRKYLEDTELACDERVLAKYGETKKKAYATALVDHAVSRNAFASAFGGARIQKRVLHILSYRRLSIMAVICFMVLAVTIGFVLLTNAS